MAAPSKLATLPDELVEEFLRRLPPSEPAFLVRAAAVCRRWCRIVSDAGFRRRFREFHRAPPAIAAIHNSVDGDAYVVRFTPTCAAFPPSAAGGRRGEAVLDCRHGRVVLRHMPAVGVDLSSADANVFVFDVWDPIADEHREVPMPSVPPYKFSVMVLCAAAGTCDHLDCHGGPFNVVLIGTDLDTIFVYTYSSEAATWSEASAIHLDTRLNYPYIKFRTGLVSGDAMIYFIVEHKILKYDLAGHAVSMISPPSSLHGKGSMALVEAKDGGLGVANVEGYNLHLWSWQVAGAGSNGVEQWVKDQVIKLDTVMPSIIATGGPSAKFDVEGFGAGTDIIFISANAGVFVVWRNSERVMKVGKKSAFTATYLDAMFSFQSFYTPVLEPEPRMSLPPSQSTEVSIERKRKRDTALGKSVRSRCGSNEQTKKAATKTRGKKRAGVKGKPEKEKKLKHDPSLNGPAMGTRSKTALLLNSPAMSTRSKRRL